jgi:Zn-finger nucleic acid-binding protein
MYCPVCHRDMKQEYYLNLEIDYCDSCNGLWFDGGEVQWLIKARTLPENFAALSGEMDIDAPRAREKTRPCPRCQVGMKKITYQGLNLDYCDHCAGTWFDAGELPRFFAEKIKANDAPAPRTPANLSLREILSGLLHILSARDGGGV